MSRLDDITISRAAWGAKPPDYLDGNFTKGEGIVIHYTTRDADGLVNHWPDCYESWRNHQRYHMVDHPTVDFRDLAYNWGICPHGYAFEGRGWNDQNGANKPVNSASLSICFDGDGNDIPGDAARQTFKDLVERAILEEGWDAQVRGHSEVSTKGTSCPGLALKGAVLPRLKAFAGTLVAPSVPTPPPPPPVPPAPPLDAVMILGLPTTTVGQMQRWAKAGNGTDLFVGLAPIAFEVSTHLGVDPAVTYAIMAHETAFGRFGGVLDVSFYNWGGIKKVAGGGDFDPSAHHQFSSHYAGVMAVAQHAGRYAGLELAPEHIVDPRWDLVVPGNVDALPDDDWVWAKDTHDDKVAKFVLEMRRA